MNRFSFLALALLSSACAETPGRAPAEPPAAEPVAAASPSAASPPARAEIHPPPSVETARDAAVPPLKTPNPLATDQDAGTAPTSVTPNEDARTAAIRRVGQIGQTCQARHASGVGGKLVLRVSLSAEGKVKATNVARDASTKALLSEALIKCVVDGARTVVFPAPRDDDTEIELPIQFAPGP